MVHFNRGPLCGERMHKWEFLTQREASMKKFTAMLLAVCIMSVAFVGCDNTSSTKTETKKSTETTTKTPPDAKKAP
jgi:hypothetical protein